MYEGIETVVIAVIAGLLYGMTTFLHKEGQTFKLNKLIGTLVISALIGIGAASSGQEVTEDMIAMQLVVYAGAVMFVENLVKIYITKSDKLISTKKAPQISDATESLLRIMTGWQHDEITNSEALLLLQDLMKTIAGKPPDG